MDNEMRIIDYDQYCNTCKYKDKKGYEYPCNDCLYEPARCESSIPSKYKKGATEDKNEEKDTKANW